MARAGDTIRIVRARGLVGVCSHDALRGGGPCMTIYRPYIVMQDVVLLETHIYPLEPLLKTVASKHTSCYDTIALDVRSVGS